MQIVVTQTDLQQIEALIEDFLDSFHPDLNVSLGTPLNDVLVQAMKVPAALLQSLATQYRETRSIAGLRRLIDSVEAGDPSEPDVIAAKATIDSAVLELVSNWYIQRAGGQKSRGLVNIHLSSNIPFEIAGEVILYFQYHK